MMTNRCLLVIALFVLESVVYNTEAESITCVYQSWSGVRGLYGNLPGDELPAELCTHVVYVYASIYENKIFNQLPALDDDSGNIAKFVSLKRRNPTLKALIGVGGWNAGGWIFSNMAATPEGRQTFIQSVIDFCKYYGLNGVFIDWLYPGVAVRGGSPDDTANFASLLSEMKSAFEDESSTSKAAQLFIGVTVSPTPGNLANYDPSVLNSAADLVYVITYDLAGWWNGTISHPAPLFTVDDSLSVDSAVKMWLTAGISPQKLVLGIPTFARTYKAPNDTDTSAAYGQVFSGDGLKGPFSSAPGFLDHSEACNRISLAKYTVVRDPVTKVPHAYSADQIIMYDDEESVKEKANYAKKNHLSGVYIFSVDQDDVQGFCGSRFPLTRAAASILRTGHRSGEMFSDNATGEAVSTPSRCLSLTKNCQNTVKCLSFTTKPAANQTEICAKGVPCVQPLAVVECPIPDSFLQKNENLFGEKQAKTVFVGGNGGKGGVTAVQCNGAAWAARKDGEVSYVCSEYGVLGRSVREFKCPVGSTFSGVYLKCLTTTLKEKLQINSFIPELME
ncbi:Acidic mammalian chitinase [Hypsibius exemplaris]|uniref:Acidic mammalian chitinase n=1 Tax=Hypsibius exemplaris TaxID=2072580 RepID=A0A9X6NIU1_HYPEX|nr:Acidic mammalian chitinase [Hypsibius exemplaris]